MFFSSSKSYVFIALHGYEYNFVPCIALLVLYTWIILLMILSAKELAQDEMFYQHAIEKSRLLQY